MKYISKNIFSVIRLRGVHFVLALNFLFSISFVTSQQYILQNDSDPVLLIGYTVQKDCILTGIYKTKTPERTYHLSESIISPAYEKSCFTGYLKSLSCNTSLNFSSLSSLLLYTQTTSSFL